MIVMPYRRHVEVTEAGEVVAFADVEPVADQAVVRATFHANAGHLPTGTRARLVDVVLDLPEARQGNRLEATLPLGDAESLDRLRERCEQVQTRPAGASCLLEAALPSRGRPPARRRTRTPESTAGKRERVVLRPSTPRA